MPKSFHTVQFGGASWQPGRVFRIRDYINISIYSFGLRGFTFTLSAIILPLLLLEVVPEDRKNTYLGLAVFVTMILAILVQPAVGALSDRARLRWGRRHPYIGLGTLTACILLPGLAFSHSFITMLAILMVITAATSVAQGPAQAYILDFVPATKRGLASAYKTGAEIVGVAAMGGLVGYIAGRFQSPDQFHWIWASLGLLAWLYLITMVLTLMLVVEDEDQRVDGRKPIQRTTPKEDARDNFLPPGMLWYLVSRFLFLAATGILETFGLFYLRDVVKVERPAEAVGILALSIGLTALVGAYVTGRLSEKMGYRPLIAISGLISGGGSIVLFWASNLSHVLLAGMIVGLGAGVFFSANWALATHLVSPSRAGQQMGLTFVATAGGTAAARLLGIGVDTLNSRSSGLGYDWLIIICGAGFLLGGLLIYAVRPTHLTSAVVSEVRETEL